MKEKRKNEQQKHKRKQNKKKRMKELTQSGDNCRYRRGDDDDKEAKQSKASSLKNDLTNQTLAALLFVWETLFFFLLAKEVYFCLLEKKAMGF